MANRRQLFRSRVSNLGWFAAYIVYLGVGGWALANARSAVVAELSRPEAIDEWRNWKAETKKMSERPGSTYRRPVKSDEPPALVLLRDHFGAIQATSWAIATFLFAFGWLLVKSRRRANG